MLIHNVSKNKKLLRNFTNHIPTQNKYVFITQYLLRIIQN